MDFKTLLEFDPSIPVGHARILAGNAGIGKSDAVRLIAKQRGMDFVDVRFSELEPGDVVGLPVVREEAGRRVTTYAAPEWWFKLHDSPNGCVLFLDEIDRAREDMQPLAMQLMLDRRAGGRDLPENCIIYAACNGPKYMTAALDQAVCNRMVWINFEPSTLDWLDWANDAKNNVHPAVTGFIRDTPKMLDTPDSHVGKPNIAVPTRRSWSRLGQMLSAPNISDKLLDIGMKLRVYAGTYVGDEAASMFHGWVKNNYQPLTVADLLSGKTKDASEFPVAQVVSILAEAVLAIESKKYSEEENGNCALFFVKADTEIFAAFFQQLAPESHWVLSLPRLLNYEVDVEQVADDGTKTTVKMPIVKHRMSQLVAAKKKNLEEQRKEKTKADKKTKKKKAATVATAAAADTIDAADTESTDTETEE